MSNLTDANYINLYAFKKMIQNSAMLNDKEAELLIEACEYHSDGLTEADITVQTCWDSDRLDLGRCGIYPAPDRLCTEAARNSEVIKSAYSRSISR